MRAMVIASFLLVSAQAGPAAAADPDFKSPETEIILAAQEAVRADDKAWFAAHLHLPVRYYRKTFRMIRSKERFLKHYATILGPELKTSILAQDPETYLKNYQGLMVGEGSRNVWFEEFGDPGAGIPSDYEIITINNSD